MWKRLIFVVVVCLQSDRVEVPFYIGLANSMVLQMPRQDPELTTANSSPQEFRITRNDVNMNSEPKSLLEIIMVRSTTLKSGYGSRIAQGGHEKSKANPTSTWTLSMKSQPILVVE